MLIVAAEYGWALWYYGGLCRDGTLLSASRVTAETLLPTLFQHVFVRVPELFAAIIAIGRMGRERFACEMGLAIHGKSRHALPAAGLSLLLLAGVLLLSGLKPLVVGYQWGYCLFLIAFVEEFVFRGLLPYLMEKSGVPAWAVWVVPGILFACMHNIMPMARNGFAAAAFFRQVLSVAGGYTVSHCAFYALRRWSGTLLLPVLIHGMLDFLGVMLDS